MSFDPRKVSVCVLAAETEIDMRNISGNRIVVYPQAAGALTVEYAAADEADECVPAEPWTPVETVDACGDEAVSTLSVEITDEDVANKCSVTIDCVRDFARFSLDVIAVGTRKSNRPAVNYTCGPTIV